MEIPMGIYHMIRLCTITIINHQFRTDLPKTILQGVRTSRRELTPQGEDLPSERLDLASLGWLGWDGPWSYYELLGHGPEKLIVLIAIVFFVVFLNQLLNTKTLS